MEKKNVKIKERDMIGQLTNNFKFIQFHLLLRTPPRDITMYESTAVSYRRVDTHGGKNRHTVIENSSES